MKALIISNRAKGWPEKIHCWRSLMPFLSGIIVVAPPDVVTACAHVGNGFIQFINEQDFISPDQPEHYGLIGFEHASFNFILRSSIICSPEAEDLLGNQFLIMDDDNIPLVQINQNNYLSRNIYTGYYFLRFSHILPKKFQFRSYDVSLQKTRQMLADKGLTNCFVFSSHMPQIIDRQIFIKACKFFNSAEYGYMICDWSMYFNFGAAFYPDQFKFKPAPVICWPMNRIMASLSVPAAKRLFENFYENNYLPNGIFHGLPCYGSGDDTSQTASQKKIILFLQQYQPLGNIRSNLIYLALRGLNILIPRKWMKIWYVVLKEEQEINNRIKMAMVCQQSVHARSYIQAMRSRRWIHKKNRVEIVGLFDYPSGLGMSARYLADTMEANTDSSISRINVSGYFKYPTVQSKTKELITTTGGGCVISMLGPPQARRILHVQNFKNIRHKKLINYLWYEANTIPANWESALCYFDEIWVHNEYIKELLTPIENSLGIPVKIRPFIPQFPKPVNMEHIFNPDKISILTIFNINSGWYRKNPEALIRALTLLPPQTAGKAELIIKTNCAPGHRHYKRLTVLARSYKHLNIKIIGKRYSDQQISGLIRGCDIYASLHRIEGLGLLPLQAMSYGKAVLATGWSGNMAYMTEDVTILVDYTLQKTNKNIRQFISDMVISDKLIFTRQVEYAEPDIQHASNLLERLIMHVDLRIERGKKAQVTYRSYIETITKSWQESA